MSIPEAGFEDPLNLQGVSEVRKVVGTLFSLPSQLASFLIFQLSVNLKLFFLKQRVHGIPLPRTDVQRVAVAAAGHGLHILLLSFLSLALGSPEVSG